MPLTTAVLLLSTDVGRLEVVLVLLEAFPRRRVDVTESAFLTVTTLHIVLGMMVLADSLMVLLAGSGVLILLDGGRDPRGPGRWICGLTIVTVVLHEDVARRFCFWYHCVDVATELLNLDVGLDNWCLDVLDETTEVLECVTRSLFAAQLGHDHDEPDD